VLKRARPRIPGPNERTNATIQPSIGAIIAYHYPLSSPLPVRAKNISIYGVFLFSVRMYGLTYGLTIG
jgi:hypothetical protein